MDDDFNRLSFISEAVIDKRGFMYHGDRMAPEEFVKTVATGKYNNTSSMYGEGLYCVRSLGDALENAVKYGRYIYKIYVRNLDRFLHLDQAAYDSAHRVKNGRNDQEEVDADFRLPMQYSEYDSYPDYTAFLSNSFPVKPRAQEWSDDDNRNFTKGMENGENEYLEMVSRQLRELGSDAGITEDDLDTIMRWFKEGLNPEADYAYDTARVKFGYSTDGFKPIAEIVEKLGIEGVTYTGRRDRRCCLVYNMSNIFPVAWLDTEAEPKEPRLSYPLSMMAGEVSKSDAEGEMEPINYSDPMYAKHRGFISKYHPIDQRESEYAKDARFSRRRSVPMKTKDGQLAKFFSDNMQRDDAKTVYKAMSFFARAYGIGRYDYSNVLLTKGAKALFDIYDGMSSHGIRDMDARQLLMSVKNELSKDGENMPPFPDISSEMRSKLHEYPLSFSRNDIGRSEFEELSNYFTDYIYRHWIYPMMHIRAYLSVLDNIDEWRKLSFYNPQYPTPEEKKALVSLMRDKLSLSPKNTAGLYGDCKLMCAVYRKMLSGAADVYEDTLRRVARLPTK